MLLPLNDDGTCDRMCRYCGNASGKCPEGMAFDGTGFLVPAEELERSLGAFAESIRNAVSPEPR